MPKIITEDELRHLECKIEEFPDGASMGQLAGASASQADREAIRRRLAKLITQGRIRKTGSRKATKYYLSEAAQPKILLHTEEADLNAEGGLFIPSSGAAERSRQRIRRPLEERALVGYNRNFLCDYIPNRTFYLSDGERDFLAKVGTSSEEVQPAGTYLKQILDRVLIDLSFNSSRLERNDYSISTRSKICFRGKSTRRI